MTITQAHCIFIAASLASGCCLHPIKRDEFKLLSPEDKAARIEKAYRDNCVRSGHLANVYLLADDGIPAAEAMKKYLREAPYEVLQWDAIITVEAVYIKGSDLRGMGYEQLLYKLCRDSPNSYVRGSAAEALHRLRHYEPGPDPESEDNPAGWAQAMEGRGPAPPCEEPPPKVFKGGAGTW